MMIKLVLILGLAALGALAQHVTEVEFTLEGEEYTETVFNGVDSKIVIIPKHGRADHTIVMHDFEKDLTVFKDLTTKRCIIIPLTRNLAEAEGILFKDKTNVEKQPTNQKITILYLEVQDQDSIEDVNAEAGKKIADLCRDFPAFRARIVTGVTTPSIKSGHVRVRRHTKSQIARAVLEGVIEGARTISQILKIRERNGTVGSAIVAGIKGLGQLADEVVVVVEEVKK